MKKKSFFYLFVLAISADTHTHTLGHAKLVFLNIRCFNSLALPKVNLFFFSRHLPPIVECNEGP